MILLRVLLAVVAFSTSLAVAAERKSAPRPADPVAPSAEALLKNLKPGHPRLLIDAAGFQSLAERVKTDATLRQWDGRLRKDAARMRSTRLPQHEIPDGLRLLSTSRRVLEHCYTLSLMYRLHSDRRDLDRLWQEMQAVAAFPDFNPRHFLDTAEMTHALAIAYDWLYDAWTADQRKTIREAMIRHGLKPGLAVYESGRGWHRSEHNWNQVCNGGLSMGALAIADEEPKLAGAILHHAIASVPRAMRSYAPDGAWGEGPGYWGYATSYNVVMLAGLESALGSDFGLSKIEGFDSNGLFPIYMTGPTGRAFNFSDSGDRVGRADPMFWLARRFRQPVFTWFAASLDRPSAQAMIWYQEPGQDPATAGLPLDKHFRKADAAVLRGAWNDPKATWVAVQAGSNRVNHNHLDLGSFVLEALGQRWAVDLGADNYNLPGFFGRERYTYYRLRAEGHNTLVLNPGQGPDQDPQATARISKFDSQPKHAFVVADLTPAYAQHAQRVQRGIALLDRRHVLVQDEVEAPKPVDFWWFLHTPAAVALSHDGRLAALRINKACLSVRLQGPAQARFEVGPAQPLPSSPNPKGQRDNAAVRRLAVHLQDVTKVEMSVLFSPSGEEPAPPWKPLAQW